MALRPASSLPRRQGAPLVLYGHPLAREHASPASLPPPHCCTVPRLAEGRNAACRLLGLQAAPPPRQRRLSAPGPRNRRWSARRARLVSLGGRRAISQRGITRRRAQVKGRWSVAVARGAELPASWGVRGRGGGEDAPAWLLVRAGAAGPSRRSRGGGCWRVAGAGEIGLAEGIWRGTATGAVGWAVAGLSLLARPAQPPARSAKTSAEEMG